MKTFFFHASIVALMATGQVAVAQQPRLAPRPAASVVQPARQAPSMSDYLDPKLAVRRNAEQRAAERRSRLAAMKWYGLSNSRPAAFATPFTGVYGNSWGGSSLYPYRWTAPAVTTVIQLVPVYPVYEQQP